MNRMKRAALLTRLIGRLRDSNNWCRETDIQKVVYFAQSLKQFPTEYEFILYKHGPFSFDLRDELTALRADGLLRLEPQRLCGVRIIPTKQSEYIQKLYPKTLRNYEDKIEFVIGELGGKRSVELERLGTALYVKMNPGSRVSVVERSERVRELVPHVLPEDAHTAVQEVDRIFEHAPCAGHMLEAAMDAASA